MKIFRFFYNPLKFINSNHICRITFPFKCTGCGSGKDPVLPVLCLSCYRELKRILSYPVCDRCGTPFVNAFPETPAHTCGSCMEFNPAFDFHKSFFFYEGAIRDILLSFKERQGYALAPYLAKILINLYRKSFKGNESFDFIIPVPIHWITHLRRGYNHSEFLAGYMSKKLNIPVLSALKKIKRGKPQKGLNRKDRLKNIRGTFSLRKNVKDAKILLIDDIYTTGTTLHEASRILKRGGAKTVAGLTIAMTILKK